MLDYASTAETTPNIAVIKYWGKRDEKLILPHNSSMSFTMSEVLKTRTTVVFSKDFTEDSAWIQHEKLEGQELYGLLRIINLIRERYSINLKAHIASLNCFPTASSASGMAALVCAATKALRLNLSPKELSILARQGSGSASRSVMGGFVEWRRGVEPDGSDSFAEQIKPASHWSEMRNVIALVDQGRKKVSSRSGMRQTIETSPLYRARLDYLPEALEKMRQAVTAKNFEDFAEITMRESDNMHAVMLDTWPPITYLNDVSRQIMHTVREDLNIGETRAAYTFDAGPNAHVYTLEKHAETVKKALKEIPGVQQVLECKVGDGPKYIEDESDYLIDPESGEMRDHFFDEASKKIVVGRQI
ncbi:MAG: diphosphomevalonate decarboxylase [Candidatus Micrarchaeia archaeon]